MNNKIGYSKKNNYITKNFETLPFNDMTNCFCWVVLIAKNKIKSRLRLNIKRRENTLKKKYLLLKLITSKYLNKNGVRKLNKTFQKLNKKVCEFKIKIIFRYQFEKNGADAL